MQTVLLIAAFLLLQPGPAQTIDRLMAVVGGEPIFLSDVRDARAMRLFDPGGALAGLSAAPADAPDAEVLERLINRRLVLAEVARYQQQPPPAAAVDRAVEVWSARFASIGERDAAVRSVGASLPIARAFLSDTLRIDAYIDQRFTAAAQPTREEARAYYQANLAGFARGGSVPGFDEIEDEARARLAEERRLQLIRDWLVGLRARAQVRLVDR